MKYTCCPLPHCSIPKDAVIVGITARAPCPQNHCTQRVRVLAVRMVGILGQSGQPPYQVVDVIAAGPHTLPYSVRREELTAVQAYVSIQEER